MQNSEYIAAFERDIASLISTADASRDRDVAACPGWKNARLLSHVGSVVHFWNELVKQKSLDASTVERAARRTEDEMAAWVSEVAAHLVTTLETANPDDMVWTWNGPRPVAWVIRRIAQEVVVHAWDAHHAAGTRFEIDAALASDGIDEFLTEFLPRRREGQPALGGSVHVHCTDVDGEWMVRESDALTLDVTREHAKGSCAIRGAAHDVLLTMWRRSPLASVEVIGDSDVATRFVELTDLD